jgi:hypothetical protein
MRPRRSPARVAGPGGFNRGVERQQVGLPGDRGNRFHDIADSLRRSRQALHLFVRNIGLLNRFIDQAARLRHLFGDFSAGRRKLVGRRRHDLHTLRRLH